MGVVFRPAAPCVTRPQVFGSLQGSDENLYGTTTAGGTSGNGTVFEITQAGVETLLYSFAGGIADGADPNVLILGSDGIFYGTTLNGGPNNLGTVFKF